jgi:hypothetical protein
MRPSRDDVVEPVADRISRDGCDGLVEGVTPATYLQRPLRRIEKGDARSFLDHGDRLAGPADDAGGAGRHGADEQLGRPRLRKAAGESRGQGSQKDQLTAHGHGRRCVQDRVNLPDPVGSGNTLQPQR